MAILHVRDFPTAKYAQIKKLAAARKRSLSQQIIALIEIGLEQEQLLEQRRQAIARVRAIRAQTRPPRKGEPIAVEMLREDRNR